MKLTTKKLKQMIREEITKINENLKRLFGDDFHTIPDGVDGDKMLISKAEELAGMPGHDASLVLRIIINRMMDIGSESDPARHPYGYDQGPAHQRIAKLKNATYLLDPDRKRTADRRPGRKDRAMNPQGYDRLTTADILTRQYEK